MDDGQTMWIGVRNDLSGSICCVKFSCPDKGRRLNLPILEEGTDSKILEEITEAATGRGPLWVMCGRRPRCKKNLTFGLQNPDRT
jgi:hypothetical protein